MHGHETCITTIKIEIDALSQLTFYVFTAASLCNTPAPASSSLLMPLSAEAPIRTDGPSWHWLSKTTQEPKSFLEDLVPQRTYQLHMNY